MSACISCLMLLRTELLETLLRICRLSGLMSRELDQNLYALTTTWPWSRAPALGQCVPLASEASQLSHHHVSVYHFCFCWQYRQKGRCSECSAGARMIETRPRSIPPSISPGLDHPTSELAFGPTSLLPQRPAAAGMRH
jgi:hypothetical protein